MNFTEEQLRGQYNLGLEQGYAKALDDVEKIIDNNEFGKWQNENLIMYSAEDMIFNIKQSIIRLRENK